MSIRDFIFACSIDDSPAYFTYDNEDSMIIIQSRSSAISCKNDFQYIEPFMESLISHETIHVVIKKYEGELVSETLDDIELIVNRHGRSYHISINNMLFAKDISGLVLC